MKFQGRVLLLFFISDLKQSEAEDPDKVQFTGVSLEESAAMMRVMHNSTRVKKSSISFLICIAVV